MGGNTEGTAACFAHLVNPLLYSVVHLSNSRDVSRCHGAAGVVVSGHLPSGQVFVAILTAAFRLQPHFRHFTFSESNISQVVQIAKHTCCCSAVRVGLPARFHFTFSAQNETAFATMPGSFVIVSVPMCSRPHLHRNGQRLIFSLANPHSHFMAGPPLRRCLRCGRSKVRNRTLQFQGTCNPRP